ncbi:MAG: sulfurtransferase [Aeromicrobium sp.]|nr:sulfurtransferase [Aeromicrobium sp.]
MTARHASVDALLAAARAEIERFDPHTAQSRVVDGAIIVDIRPGWQRESDGEIPGSVIVERNHLEWRLHPESGASLPLAADGQAWIVVCTEGYTSSLAAASLVSLGLPAGDIIGGIHAWRDAGLPIVAGPTELEHRVAVPNATA